MSAFIKFWLVLVLLFAGACSFLQPDDRAALRANADDAYASGFIDEDQYHRILAALDRESVGDRLWELAAILLGGAVGGAGGPAAARGMKAGAKAIAHRITRTKATA